MSAGYTPKLRITIAIACAPHSSSLSTSLSCRFRSMIPQSNSRISYVRNGNFLPNAHYAVEDGTCGRATFTNFPPST